MIMDGENINSLMMILIIVIPGIVLSRKNIINEKQSLGLSALVVNVTWPCLVLDAMQIPFKKSILRDCGYVFVIMIFVFIVAFLIALLLVKIIRMEKHRSYIFVFMALFANTAFMGIPIINALYGKEAVFYASIIETVNNIFIFSIGIILIQLSGSQKPQMALKEMISPGMAAVVIGFILFLLDCRLPGFLGGSIYIIGSATTSLTMIVIGLQLGRMRIKELVNDISAYALSFVKLIIIPVFVTALMLFALKDSSLMAKVIIVEFAMPSGSVATLLAQKYKGDVKFATKCILITTVFSMFTLPVVINMLSGV